MALHVSLPLHVCLYLVQFLPGIDIMDKDFFSIDFVPEFMSVDLLCRVMGSHCWYDYVLTLVKPVLVFKLSLSYELNLLDFLEN